MKKEFNVTGSCNPEWHYMVDTAKRFEAVENWEDDFVGHDLAEDVKQISCH